MIATIDAKTQTLEALIDKLSTILQRREGKTVWGVNLDEDRTESMKLLLEYIVDEKVRDLMNQIHSYYPYYAWEQF